MRAVIYCRVSTVEQAQNLSLPTQEQACRDYCAREGYEAVQVFVDAGESAKTVDRPAFLQMLAYCQKKAHGVHAVVVHSLTRFSRNSSDHHAIAALLRGSGVTLRSATEPIDESPVGKLMEAILAGVAQFDNDVKAARSIEGMKTALAKGRWVWQPPLGYRSGDRRAPGAPSLDPDPIVAPLIRQAFTWVADGVVTGRRLNRKLLALGLKGRGGKPLALSRLYAILHNPVYAGRIENRGWGTSTRGDFTPIVTEELFARVQRQLTPAAIAATRSTDRPDYPLRRFVRCGSCQKPLTGSESTGRAGRRYGFYHCPKGCVRVRREHLEDAFLSLLDRLRPDPAFIRLLHLLVIDTWKEMQAGEQTQRRALERNVTQLEGKLARLDQAFIFDRRIDETTYRARRDELRRELTVTRLDLTAVRTAEQDVESLLEFAEYALANASAIWTSAATTEQRMQVQLTMFPDGVTWGRVHPSDTADQFFEPRSCLEVFELRGRVEEIDGMASPTGTSWNQLLAWLQHMQGAKIAA